MKKRLFPLFLVFTLLSLAACSGADIQAKLGQEFSLAIGESATLSSEKMKIEFVAVTADSRCPSGAQCIWAGEAKCTVIISLDGNEQMITLTQPGGNSSVVTSMGGYSLSFNLNPYPQVGEQIENKDYRLILTINKG